MEKKSTKVSTRLRVRCPAQVKAFTERFAQLLAISELSQGEVANKLGGVGPQLITRLKTGGASTLPIDFVVDLARWADFSGISLRWLLVGLGPMRKGDISQPVSVAQGMNELTTQKLVLALAERAGVDLSDIIAASAVAMYLPEWGFQHVPLGPALERIEAKTLPPALSADEQRVLAMYRSVPPEGHEAMLMLR